MKNNERKTLQAKLEVIDAEIERLEKSLIKSDPKYRELLRMEKELARLDEELAKHYPILTHKN